MATSTKQSLTAKASTMIAASKAEVWAALLSPQASPLTGLPDRPESYHLVTIELSGAGDGTRVVLTQDNNASEEARLHSEKNWETMLGSLKAFVEGPGDAD